MFSLDLFDDPQSRGTRNLTRGSALRRAVLHRAVQRANEREGIVEVYGENGRYRIGPHYARYAADELSTIESEQQTVRNDNVRLLAKNLSKASSSFILSDSSSTHLSISSKGTTNISVSVAGNPFQPPPDSSLDPNGDGFDARAWTKAVLKQRSEDPEKYPQKTAGVAFRQLHAYGFGLPTDYQKTVGNVWLQVVSGVRKLFGAHGRRIDILRDLNGVVKAGEMLLILGPPGSGCTTFLKTISGETHGFKVAESSRLNYQGKFNVFF